METAYLSLNCLLRWNPPKDFFSLDLVRVEYIRKCEVQLDIMERGVEWRDRREAHSLNSRRMSEDDS